MKYIKEFENYTIRNIDKKYYVWKLPHYPEPKIGVIEVLDSSTKNIKYLSLKRTDWRGKDFFTGQKKEALIGNIVLLRKWKRDKHNILFETDNEEDAIDFYNVYLQYNQPFSLNIVNKDNWKIYKGTNKFNI